MPEDNSKLSQDELYKRVASSSSGSLMKKYLTPEVYNKLKNKVTAFGGTLGDCIRSGESTFLSF